MAKACVGRSTTCKTCVDCREHEDKMTELVERNGLEVAYMAMIFWQIVRLARVVGRPWAGVRIVGYAYEFREIYVDQLVRVGAAQEHGWLLVGWAE